MDTSTATTFGRTIFPYISGGVLALLASKSFAARKQDRHQHDDRRVEVDHAMNPELPLWV